MNRPEVLAARSDAAPEFLQRLAVARQHNQRAAELRILDREFYRAYRSYIRIPVNAEERARNERLSLLTNALHMRLLSKPSVALLRAMREARQPRRLTPCELTGDPS